MAENKCEGTAVLSYGSTLEVENPTSFDWLFVGGLTDFNGPQSSRGEIETTTLCSTAKEYALDLKDLGTFTSTMQTRYGDPAQQILLANMDSTETLNFRLTLPDDGYGNGPVVLMYKGRVQSFPVQGSMGQVISTSLSIRITGDVDFIFPASLGINLSYSTFVLTESPSVEGMVDGMVVLTLSGAVFAGSVGEPLPGASFTNVPTGLTAICTKTGQNTAAIGFAGTADDHGAGDSANVSVSFTDETFVNVTAAEVLNSSGKIITINFTD